MIVTLVELAVFLIVPFEAMSTHGIY